MDKSKKDIYAVLTGDLVRSSRLEQKQFEAAKECLTRATKTLDTLAGDNTAGLVKGGVDFYRGDGWQLLLTGPKYALRACLFIRAYLRAHAGVDTRISAGVGTVSHIDTRKISASTGKAFELSGTALDKLKGRRRMTISLPYYLEEANVYYPCVYELCDAVIQRWTQAQAEKLCWALQGLNLEEIAVKLKPPIKPASVGGQLRSAGWYAVESVLEKLENKQQGSSIW